MLATTIVLLSVASFFALGVRAEEVPEYVPDTVIMDRQETDMNLFKAENYFPEKEYEAALLRSRLERNTPFFEDDYRAIVQGLDTIRCDWHPSRVALFGENAFPVATSGKGDPNYAAARYGKGKVFAAGRVNYFTNTDGQVRMVKNVVNWLANGKENATVASRDGAKMNGFDDGLTNVAISDLTYGGGVDVYFMRAHAALTDEEVEKVLAFVEEGGGIIVVDQAWWWGSNNAHLYSNFPGNKVLIKVGMLITWFTWAQRDFPTADTPPAEANLYYAFEKIKTDPENAVASTTISRTSGYILSEDNVNRPEFQDIFNMAIDVLETTENSRAYSPLARKLIPLLVLNEENLSKISLGPGVEKFPGLIDEDVERVTRTVSIKGNTTDKSHLYFGFSQQGRNEWRSTGLYAPPAEPIKYKIPEEAVGKIYMQIGCHTDSLYHHGTLHRAPEIVMNFKPSQEEGYIINPFGGLIYVTLPHGSTLGYFNVTFEGVVLAPYFVYGEMTNEDWIEGGIRDYPAPWAEIEVPEQIIFSVPSSVIRVMEDAEEYGGFWDHMMNTANRFAGFVNLQRHRAERFAFDIQIGGGWMHSGYPMMGFTSALMDRNAADGRGALIKAHEMWKYGSWGPFHEVGHNHQWSMYTIGKTTETGCNWWSVVMMGETIENSDLSGHGALANRDARAHDWYFRGKPFEEWSVWLALDTYIILAEEFGWESYTETFKIYYENYAADADTLRKDDIELNEWVVRYSSVVDRNLCPYFEWWQFPLTDEIRERCAQFPDMEFNLMEEYDHPTEHRGDCPLGWEAYGDSCFFFSDEKRDWFDAEAVCQEMSNSHLASCLTRKELAYVNHVLGNADHYKHWMGYNDLQIHADWVNLDNTTMLEDFPWGKHHPNNDDNTHCALNYHKSIRDWGCLAKEKFICHMADDSCAPIVSCPEGWIYFMNKCYMWHFPAMRQREGEQFCRDHDAHLVEIDSKEESDFVVHMSDSARHAGRNGWWASYWIGLKDCSNGWGKWESGADVVFENWCEGEPNSWVASGKAYLWAAHGFCWDDTPWDSRLSVICEKHMDYEEPGQGTEPETP